MSKNNFAAVVLAAGLGTRMRSRVSKVLHIIGGMTIIERTVRILEEASPRQIIIVANKDNLSEIKNKTAAKYDYAIQYQPKGTADAAQVGAKLVQKNVKDIAVINGDDNIFYKPQTIKDVLRLHQKEDAIITFLTLKVADPYGLGRVVRLNGKVVEIAEEKDASDKVKKIKEVNGGFYFMNKDWFLKNVKLLKPSKVTGELYITDLIKEAAKQNEKIETWQLKDLSQYLQITTKEDLKKAGEILERRIHIMGIGGAGASAAAAIAKVYGWQVNGCDKSDESPYGSNVKDIDVEHGHNPAHLLSTGMLVVSPAVVLTDPKNSEIEKAKEMKIPEITWQEFQGKYLQKNKFTITVAGAYGKSTTTAMVSKILEDQGLDPTCEIGAKVLGWGRNFRVGRSKYYVCEADEYNDNFLNYQSDIAVILNVAWDHPDYFKTKRSVMNSYIKFVNNIKHGGTLILGSDPIFNRFAKPVKFSNKGSDPQGVKIVQVGNFGQIDLKIIGDFRNENARAALTVAKLLNLDLELAKKSLSNFTGVGRRLEFKGEVARVKVYDDYAVQPYTVMTTVNALTKKFPKKKIVLVFEPHTFSRIKTFFDDFVKSLKSVKVEKIFVTDVFAARERGDRVLLSRQLARAVGAKAAYSGSLEKTAKTLCGNFKKWDIILSMGAGSSYKLYDLIAKFHG